MMIKELHNLFLKSSGIVIDTKKISPNSIFLAIKGDRFDANTFAQEALDKGASYVIIDNRAYFIDERTILVTDSLQTLQELAKYHRNFLKLPIIALTGSNGKTTTKELIQAVLSQKFKTKATVGNLNNHIGLPLTLLSFDKNTEIGIVEMGANHQKEIEFLCTIAQPDYGYITNFGKAHLEGFGGIEGVIKGKSELYNYLKNYNKKAFVNLQDALQEEKTRAIDRYTFGQKFSDSDVTITCVEASPFVTVSFENLEIKSKLIGFYNANNINSAITIGKYFGVSNIAIQTAIESYVPENNRSQLVNKGSNQIILDAYNANPSSMKVALENFIQLDKQNKLIIIGDMFELGNESLLEHKLIVDSLVNENDLQCIFVGNNFYENKIDISNFKFFRTFEDFKNFFENKSISNQTILIKGSRGMALERTLDIL